MTVPAADLFTSVPATLHNRGKRPIAVTLDLHWSTHDPIAVLLTIRDKDRDSVVWEVARSLFVHATQEWATGAWLGGGDFALCIAPDRTLLAFKPARPESGIIDAPTRPIRDFINHSEAILKTGHDETETIQRHLDTELGRILRNA